MTAPRPDSWRYRVQHVDVDASGVVHFSRYASLLETVLLERLDASGAGLAALAKDGVELAVSRFGIRYHAPARFLDVLSGTANITHVGGASFRARGSLYLSDQADAHMRLAEGDFVFGTVGIPSGKPAVLPTPIRRVLKGLVSDAEHHPAD